LKPHENEVFFCFKKKFFHAAGLNVNGKVVFARVGKYVATPFDVAHVGVFLDLQLLKLVLMLKKDYKK
jgi:hypothetical protein